MRKTGRLSRKMNGEKKESSPVGTPENASDIENDSEHSESEAAQDTVYIEGEPLRKKSKQAKEVAGKEAKKTPVSESKIESGSEEDELKDIPLKKRSKKSKKAVVGKKMVASKAKKMSDSEPEEYEVEKVVDMRERNGKRQFLIRWKGYKANSDTWEAEEGLSCDAAIKAFIDSLPPPKAKKAVTPAKGKKKKKEEEAEEEEETTEEYEVERIVEVHHKKNGTDEFLVRWKGYGKKDDTWEPENRLNCPDLIAQFKAKVEKAKAMGQRELRVVPAHTDRFTLSVGGGGRRLSRRQVGKQRTTYHEQD